VFAGWRDRRQLADLFAAARCVVLPSLCFETFGNTIVEAFAHGRPVIVSDIGAPAEIVRSGATGLKVPPAGEAALAEALAAVLADGSLVDRLGACARREYLARYTHETNVNRLMRIYRFAMARNRAVAAERPVRALEPSPRPARTGRRGTATA
jgi:glycosyltransferase involved in cell wall biosynthesis